MNAYVIGWLVAFLVLCGMEALTAALTSIWFAGGAFFAMIAASLRWPFGVQLAVFLAFSILTLIFVRPLFGNHLKIKNEKTNADRIIGEEAKVTEPINPVMRSGQVVVLGQIWSAVSDENEAMQAGEAVTVVAIRGVKAVVQKKNVTEYKEE